MTLLFRFSIISLAFTSLAGFSIFGELSNDLSTYLYLILIPVTLVSYSFKADEVRIINRFVFLISVGITISFLANIEYIFSAELKGRSALNKFITSSIVVIFMILVSYTAIPYVKNYYNNIIRPLYWGVIVCGTFSIPEIISWYSTGFANFYEPIASIIHTRGDAFSSLNRLRSVAFEPMFLSMFLGFAIVWLLAAKRLNTKHAIQYRLAIYAAVAMIILSVSRTGYVFIIGLFTLDFITYRLLSSKSSTATSFLKPLGFYYTLFITISVIIMIFSHKWMVQAIVAGDNLSNLARLASNTAAFNIFMNNPVFGGGFGQYAHHAIDTMPSWGYFSWEIVEWFTNPDAGWPPCFTMFGRIAAEMGIIGLMIWYGFWIWLLNKILRQCIYYKLSTSNTPIVGNAMLTGIAYVLLSGVPSDTLALPTMWIQLTLCSLYITGKISEPNHGK